MAVVRAARKRTYTEWQYEYRTPRGVYRWITEDDEWKASYKASKQTGRVRSREVEVRESEWIAKEQDMV